MSCYTEKNEDAIIYRCAELNSPGVIQGFSTKDHGNMALHTGDVPERVIENRQRFLASLDLDLDNLIAGKQVHGTQIQVVKREQLGSEAFPATDVLITRERGVILSIYTADCLPIFIYDPQTPAVGLVHAGWRGTLAKIVSLTFEKMMAEFNTNPKDCSVAIGPSIGPTCFRVDSELAARFADECPPAVIKDDLGYTVDLWNYNILLLQQAGVSAQRVFSSGLCTGCHPETFFSYRAEGGTIGRMMGVIGLK